MNQRTLISSSQQLRIAEVLCQCLSLMMGKPQSSLMWLSAPQPSLSVLKPTRHKCSLKAHAWCRHPIKALRTPCSKLSQLGCIWAQIFEKCLVQLAEHHRIPCPKQKFGGSVQGWRTSGEGLWILEIQVYIQVLPVYFLSIPKFLDESFWQTICSLYCYYWTDPIIFKTIFHNDP